MPGPGTTYPATFAQLTSWFPDDEACAMYLARLRWPDGFRCSRCGCPEAWQTAVGLWLCRSSAQDFGDGGDDLRPVTVAAHELVRGGVVRHPQKNGVSALGLLEPKGFGRVRLARLREVNSTSLCGFVGSVGTPGVTVRTDGGRRNTVIQLRAC